MAITLDALITELEGIGKFNPNNFYRAHGTGGLEDFKSTGMIRANPTGQYNSTYYSKGGPETRYLKRGSGAIVEALPTEKIYNVPDSRRYSITTPENTLGLSDRIRVYEKTPTGYSVAYDNITPWKYGLRQGVGMVGPNLIMGAGEALLSNLFLPPEERSVGRLIADAGRASVGMRQPLPAERLTLEDILKLRK